MGGAACDDQLLLRSRLFHHLLPRGNEVLQTLFRYDARQKQDITVHLQPIFLLDDLGRARLGRLDPIRDILGRAVVGLTEVRLVVVREHDDLVCVLDRLALTDAKNSGCQSAPLPALPVETMDGDNDLRPGASLAFWQEI